MPRNELHALRMCTAQERQANAAKRMEFVEFEIVGASFLYHQIRKMVGFVVAMVRRHECGVPSDKIPADLKESGNWKKRREWVAKEMTGLNMRYWQGGKKLVDFNASRHSCRLQATTTCI